MTVRLGMSAAADVRAAVDSLRERLLAHNGIKGLETLAPDAAARAAQPFHRAGAPMRRLSGLRAGLVGASVAAPRRRSRAGAGAAGNAALAPLQKRSGG